MTLKKAILLAPLILTPNGGAWNGKCHMTVAYTAFQKLVPAVKPKVHELLMKNPDYKTWVKSIPKQNQEERLLAAFLRASQWPDDIKGKSGFRSDGTSNGNVPPQNDPTASQNIGYKDKLRHKYWHFHDKPFSSDDTPTRHPPTPSALTQIPILRDGLKSSTSDSVRSYALVWLIHLVGDVHQPLHAAARFTANQKDGDDGGNGVKLTNRQGTAVSSLHSFWDGLLGDNDVEDAIALGDALLEELGTPAGADVTDVATWIDESFQLAQQSAYVSPIKSDGSPSRTNSTYRGNARALAEKQVVLGAHRLARLINDSVKP